MAATKNKVNVLEEAKNITGYKFLMLDNIPYKKEEGKPRKMVASGLIYDKIAMNDTPKRARLVDATHQLEKDGMIESEWSEIEKIDGTDKSRVYRKVRLTEEGAAVLDTIFQDPNLKVRALLLALQIRSAEAIVNSAPGILSDLYEKIKIADISFSIAQRDKSQNQA
ncbi:MAG: hypothetical protein KGH65_03075 [Candidatus Micrarchaeota archaeon]|nr:hypothetical protein [Candidatus Micrarchaeota archaeon]